MSFKLKNDEKDPDVSLKCIASSEIELESFATGLLPVLLPVRTVINIMVVLDVCTLRTVPVVRTTLPIHTGRYP